MAKQMTITLDTNGYVDEAQALQLAQAISHETGGDVDEICDWVREGDFRDGEAVSVAALVNEWREYLSAS